MHPEHPVLSMNMLLNFVRTPGGATAMIILFNMFQYIFKLDFVCPCDLFYNILFCGLYVLLPFFIVTLTVMLIDPHCTWECKLNGCRTRMPHFSSIVLRSLLPGLVWVITAFIDGDVIVCLFATNMTAGQQDACVEVTKQSPEQQRTINLYVNVSRIGGLSFILIMSLLCACWNSYHRKTYCDSLFEKYIEEHIEASLNDEQSELAKAEAEKRITLHKRKIQPPGRDDSQMDRGETQNLPDTDSNPALSPHSPRRNSADQIELPNVRRPLLQS